MINLCLGPSTPTKEILFERDAVDFEFPQPGVSSQM